MEQANIKQQDESISSTKGFEVFNTQDSINAWVPCEIVDIVAQNHSTLFKVRLTANFKKQLGHIFSSKLI